MKHKIKVLPENLANMIAAGEVIERPASVVKELIENSIDAGADRIEIDCHKSGKKLIRIIDNGSGMEYDDALICFERHATSKINSAQDLNTIHTLGFRGEALPSISSVSEMTLTTRPPLAKGATRISLKNGTIKGVTETGSPIGTIVEVKNLFSNLPARAKFLRSDQTELAHTVQTVIRQALPRPDISFIFRHNGHINLSLPVALNLKERFGQIMGQDLIENIFAIEGKREGIKINGYISPPDSVRSNPINQYIYVNKRFIKSPIIQKVIHEAYHPQLPRQKYPVFLLLIDIDPSKVDFNVHPAKLEIRFDEPSIIIDLIGSIIKDSLTKPLVFSKLTNPQFAKPLGNKLPTVEKTISVNPKESNTSTLMPRTRQMPLIKESPQKLYEPKLKEPEIRGLNTQTEGNLPTLKEEGDRFTELQPKGPFMQIENTYILYESLDGIVIIDQHAAHERINYERVKSSLLSEHLSTQTLITQPIINITYEEEALMKTALPLLKRLGFSLEPFGKRTYILRSVPLFLNIDPAPLLQAILLELMEQRTLDKRQQMIDPIAATIACHLSIKANQPLKNEEVKQLIKDLLSAQNPFKCPHGRPTLFRISIKELQKNFGRI